jgi:cobalt/nickel transport system permease protein
MLLFAVHISANVLSAPALVLGFAGMIVLLAVGLFRIREEEIARIGLLTAALFVASSIHVPLGPTSVHLLLNGLAGVILGRRVGVAIPVSLLLQAWLLGHGDLSTLGVNSCIMALPALLARPLFQRLLHTRSLGLSEATLAFSWLLSPWTLLVTCPLVIAARRVRRELSWAAEFESGFVTGAITVVLTSLLNALALTLGGVDDFRVVAALTLTMHLPLALVEGAILGSIANLLIRVKPALLLPESAATLRAPSGECRPSLIGVGGASAENALFHHTHSPPD